LGRYALQGQLIFSDCETMIGGGLRIQIRPQLRARSRLRFLWECATDEGCAVAIAMRVRSAPRTRRVFTVRGDRPFQMRSRRAPRRGDVVSITMLAPSVGNGNFAARWRVALTLGVPRGAGRTRPADGHQTCVVTAQRARGRRRQ